MTNLVPSGDTNKMLSPQQQKIMSEIISHETHWMMRVFPTRVDVERMKYKVNVFKLQAESDYTMIKMHREAMHQAFQENLETMLINGKAETRVERTKFYGQQLVALEQSIAAITDQFLEISHQRFDRLIQITHPLMLELEKQSINDSITCYYTSIKSMKDRFSDIPHERVRP